MEVYGKIRSLGMMTGGVLVLAVIVFLVIEFFSNRTHVVVDEAIATDIEVAIQNSQIVVVGIVLDDKGEARNLRRDSADPSEEDSSVIVPGTDYPVLVTKVLKGSLEPDASIQIAVPGGSYKGKKSKLRATLNKDEEYLFMLAPSGMGHPHYFGIIEPSIYQFKDGKLVAISNVEKYKSAFQESSITEEELFERYVANATE
jgi:hypothetical protein